MQQSVIFIKKNLEINVLKIKSVIVTIQGNIEALHIAYVIKNIVYLKQFP